MQNIPSVEPFLVDKSITTNLDKKWNSYVDEFELFIVASGVTDKKQKLALLLHLGGKDLREIYKTVKEEKVVDITKEVRYDLLIYCLLSDIILSFLLVAATSLRAGFQVYLS